MTPKQRRFADEYLVDGNGARAALAAGYSANRSDQLALQVLRNVEVQAYIAERQQALSIRVQKSQDDVATRLADIAWTDMTDIAEWGDGKFVLRDSSELSEAARSAIKTLKVKRRTEVTGPSKDPTVWIVESIEVGLDDRLKATELFGRHIGMWPREAAQINVDARRQTLVAWPEGTTIDDLRQLAAGVGDDDGE